MFIDQLVVRAGRAVLAFILALGALVATNSIARAQTAPDAAPPATATVSGTVLDAAGHAVAAAEVTLQGVVTLHATSNSHGAFAIHEVPLGTYRLTIVAQGLGQTTQDQVSVGGDTVVSVRYASGAAATGLHVIGHVTTTSAPKATINVTPVSQMVITPADFRVQGETQWRRVLQDVPGVSIGYSYASNNPVGSPLSPQVITIDGTLPYETATLVDGMPIVTRSYGPIAGNGVDLAQYDPYAFSSYSITRGPSAQSPTILNAVGGTLDLRTPGFVSQNHVDLTVGNDVYGGVLAGLAVRQRFNRLSIAADYNVDDSPGPFNAGLINFNQKPATVDGKPFSCTVANGCANTSPAGAPQNVGLVMCCLNASTAWSRHYGSAALSYAISNNVTAELFYTGSRSETGLTFANTEVNFVPPAGYTGSFPSGSSYLYSVFFPYPTNGIYLTSSLLEGKVRVAVGQGEFHAAMLSNGTSYNFPDLYESKGTPFSAQLWGSGDVGGTPTVFNGEKHDVTVYPFGLLGNQFSHDRAYILGYSYGSGSTFHGGLDYVQSTYDTPIDYVIVSGNSSTSTTFNPQTNFQQTQEVRFRLGGPVARNVSADLALYFTGDRYHVQSPADPSGATYIDRNFGYTGPRLGVVWQPNTNVAVRATAGGAFSEPYLASLIGTNGPPTANNPASPSYYTQSITNVNIKPETSFGYTLGSDVRIRPDTVASLDAYYINLWGQFYDNLTPAGTFAGLPLYSDQINNLTQSRFEGVVASLRHDVPHGPIYGITGGFTRGYVVSVPPGFYDTPAGKNTTNLGIVPGINFNGGATSGVSIPYSQASGQAGYRWSPDKYAALDAVYYGPNNSYYQPAFLVLNLNAGMALSRYVTLRASFLNMTAQYDKAVAINNPANTFYVPSVAGLPSTWTRQQYGPRTLVVTTTFHL